MANLSSLKLELGPISTRFYYGGLKFYSRLQKRDRMSHCSRVLLCTQPSKEGKRKDAERLFVLTFFKAVNLPYCLGDKKLNTCHSEKDKRTCHIFRCVYTGRIKWKNNEAITHLFCAKAECQSSEQGKVFLKLPE